MAAAEDDDLPASRGELLKARSNLQRQLWIVANPVLGGDRNPQLVQRLRTMLAEIDESLAQIEGDDA